MKYSLILLVFFLGFHLQAQKIDRIEPPFWWTEMNHNQLELMIYGENISDYIPTIANDKVILVSVKRTENKNYLFLNLDLSKAISGQFEINFSKKETKNDISIDYELKERRRGSKMRAGFNSSDVIYLIMPDRFANGDYENDSHPDLAEKLNRRDKDGRHGGDIQGIIDNLDYINELGVTAIWSTPMLEDNEPTYSYHTYAQSDLYKIDPRYGANEDYMRLSDEMHKRDMKLIMDYVTNHWGSKHWMILDLPAKDWVNYWENGFKRSNYRKTTQFDINRSRSDAKGCMDGWFDTTMPDMNQRNPLLLNYIVQNAIWWIEYANLDGLRVDTYPYADKEGIARWTKAVMDEYPNLNVVGETEMHDQAQNAYWQKDSKIGAIEGYNSNLPSVMDFILYDAIKVVFDEDQSNFYDGMIKVYDTFTNDFLYPDINNVLVFGENHDTNRINQIYPSIEDYKLVMTLVATVRGIPQIYYGSEIGMKGNKEVGDGDIRRDFPGGWKEDLENAFTIEGRTKFQEEYVNFTKKLFNWRKGKEVIHLGKTMQFAPENNVYVYFRYNDDDTVMVIINNNSKSQDLDLNRFHEIIKDFKTGQEIISRETISLENSLEVKGKSSMIIELN